jgi:hypothetical protein
MDANLKPILDQILGDFSPSELSCGLEPPRARLEALFGGVDHAINPDQLVAFCTDYIRLVPEQAIELEGIAKTLNLQDIIDPYVGLAVKYLHSACTEIRQSDSSDHFATFLILLQGAYIFGRMQEELDDKVEAFIGTPVSQLNLMDANLIVHEIIGDNFANRLDKVVESLIQQSKISKGIIEANLDKAQVDAARQARQSLLGQEIESFAARYGYNMTEGLL